MDWKETAGVWLQRAMTLIEWVVAATLIVLAAVATWGLVLEFGSVGRLVTQDVNAYTTILDGTLLVFVIAELFKIALAYIRHEDVIPTVMEAALVAVARKVVVLDVHAAPVDVLLRAGSLGALLLAVGVSWYLLSRANPLFARRVSAPDQPPDAASPKADGGRVR
jgi:uncharacterized membrane protein (DUF373 family)